jgi:hypothetical protein
MRVCMCEYLCDLLYFYRARITDDVVVLFYLATYGFIVTMHKSTHT